MQTPQFQALVALALFLLRSPVQATRTGCAKGEVAIEKELEEGPTSNSITGGAHLDTWKFRAIVDADCGFYDRVSMKNGGAEHYSWCGHRDLGCNSKKEIIEYRSLAKRERSRTDCKVEQVDKDWEKCRDVEPYFNQCYRPATPGFCYPRSRLPTTAVELCCKPAGNGPSSSYSHYDTKTNAWVPDV